MSEFGRLDVLGNVAGIYVAGHVTDMTLEQYRRIMGVNLDGYFFLAQAAIPHLLETSGNIVNIASNAGLQGVPYSVAYAMTKGGVVQLTRSLAVEFLKRPLRVNAIAPAGTNTNIAASTEFPADVDVDLATPDGGPPRDGGTRGGRRAVRVPRLRRSALHHRRDLHARQRPHRQLKDKGVHMRMDDMILVSIDDHMIEPPDMYQHHVPAKWLDEVPKVVRNDAGRRRVGVPGQKTSTPFGMAATVGWPREEWGFNPGVVHRAPPGLLRRARAGARHERQRRARVDVLPHDGRVQRPHLQRGHATRSSRS